MIAPNQLDHAAYPRRCRRMSAAELLYTLEDCRASIAAWPDSPNAGRYQDEIHYVAAELERRRRGGHRQVVEAEIAAETLAAELAELLGE